MTAALARWSPEPGTADSAVAAIAQALLIHGVAATRGYIQRAVHEYPGQVTPAALVELLQLWGVDTVPMAGSADELPADVAGGLVPLAGGRYGVVLQAGPADVTLVVNGATRQLTHSEFDAVWNGMLLVLEPRDGAGEPFASEHEAALRMDRMRHVALVLAVPALLAAAALAWPPRGWVVALALLKLVGLAATVALSFEQAGIGRPLQRLCPAGPVANCGRVLRSPASRLGPVPLADLGLVYFGGGFAALVLGTLVGQGAALLSMLSVLSLALLPFTVLSVYYQAVRLRAYCWLCLLAAALLWLEAAAGVLSGAPLRVWPGDSQAWMVAVLAWGGVAAAWLGLRALLVAAWQGRGVAQDFARFRSQPLVVQALWDTGAQVVPPVLRDVCLGSPAAPVQVLLAVLPACPACGRQVRAAWALQVALGTRMAITLRFLRGGEPAGAATPALRDQYLVADGLAALLMHVAGAGDQAWLRQVCAGWFFDAKDRVSTPAAFAAWQDDVLAGRAAPDSAALMPAVLEHHHSLQRLGIEAAPVVFVNGRRLPPEWDPMDLRYFLLRELRRSPSQL